MNNKPQNILDCFVNGESTICCQLKVYLRSKEFKAVIASTSISFFNVPLRIDFNIDSKYDVVMSQRIRDWSLNDNMDKSIAIGNGLLDQNIIVENIKAKKIHFERYYHVPNSKESTYSITIDSLFMKWHIDEKSDSTYYRLTENAVCLNQYLTGLLSQFSREFIINGEKYILFYVESGKYLRVFVETEGDIECFCSFLSFYVGAMVEWDIKITDKQGCRNIEVKTSYYKQLYSRPQNNALAILCSNETHLGHLEVFQEKFNNKEIIINEDLIQLFEQYARASVLDEHSRFLFYYVILEKMANLHNVKGDNLKNYLSQNGINFEVLGKDISKYNLIDSWSNKINNITQLRNELIHHIGNKKIGKYLHDSEISFRMECAACIVVLSEMHFENIKFIEDCVYSDILTLPTSDNHVKSLSLCQTIISRCQSWMICHFSMKKPIIRSKQ